MTHNQRHNRPRRPWFVSDRLCDGYVRIGRNGGDVELIQKLKAIRMLTVNLIVGALGAFSMLQGGDPTVVGPTAIVVLGLLNGIELSEWLAAKQALSEIQRQDGGD